MKICLLTDKYPPDPGGLAVSSRRLAQGLVTAGHSVHVCLPTANLPPGQVTQTDVAGIIIHRLGRHRRSDDTWADCFDLVTQLHHQEGFDLLHGYYLAGPGFITVYAGRYLNLPSLISARGNDIDRAAFNPDHQAAIMWALTQATAVTAVSQELARKIHTLASTCRPLVIANGVDTTLFSPAQSCFEAKLAQDQAAVIGFVGEARLKKGLAVLLPAFAHVAQQLSREGRSSPTLLLIGGVRKDDADIVRVFQAQQPTLTVKIIPYTNQAELPLWYQRLDVLVLPSLRDGLPNALLEGMACGCAVVASHVGGIPDVLRSGENGLLVPPGQVEPLARAIIQLLASPQQRQVFGQAARQTVLDNFSPALELTANLKLYRQLLTEPTTLGTLTISGPGLTAK